MARLFVLSGAAIGTTFDFLETSTVGRGDDADIQIAEVSISRKHARLVPRDEPGAWKVIDLKSSNGVFIGGKRVTSGIIRDGDTFRLGEVELRLRDEAADEEPGAVDAGESSMAFVEVSEDTPEEPAFEPEVEFEMEPELEFGEELELEFADDDDEPAAAPARPADNVSRRSADAPAARPSARVSRPGGATAVAGGGRPVLQYASRHHRASGDDLAQASGGKRALIYLLAIAALGAIAYGTFTLTRTARSQSATIDGDVDGDMGSDEIDAQDE